MGYFAMCAYRNTDWLTSIIDMHHQGAVAEISSAMASASVVDNPSPVSLPVVLFIYELFAKQIH